MQYRVLSIVIRRLGVMGRNESEARRPYMLFIRHGIITDVGF